MEIPEEHVVRDSYHERHDNRIRRLFALLLMLAFLAVFVVMIWPFFEALLLAAVFAALLHPLYARLRARTHRPVLASLATTLLGLFVIVAPLTALIGVLTREAAEASELVAPWMTGEPDTGDIAEIIPPWMPYRDEILPRLGEVIDRTGAFVLDRLTAATQSTVVFLVNLFILLYAMFFFLLRGERLVERVHKYTPLIERDRDVIVERGLAVTRATLKSIFVIGAMQGALGGIGFAVAGIDAPILWGVVMAVASAVPTLGTALVWVPACAILLFTGNTWTALGLFAWCATFVSGSDNIVRPHLIGSDARMPDLVVLLSTLGGIGLFGVTGLVIGPVLAGLFLTSVEIFAATFEHELKDGAGTPTLIRTNGRSAEATALRPPRGAEPQRGRAE